MGELFKGRKKKSLKTVQGRVIISYWKGKALGTSVFAVCVYGAAGTTEARAHRGLQGGVQVVTLQVRDALLALLHCILCPGAKSAFWCSEGSAAGSAPSSACHPLCLLHVL